MSRDKYLLTTLHKLFPDRLSKDCLDTNDTAKLVIYEDTNGRACLTPVEQTDVVIGFLLHNSSKKQIYLLALDHCFFADDEGQRCDGVVFNDQYFCFVELKLKVRPRRTTQGLKEARKQLGATIQFFKAAIHPNSKNFFNFILEAYVVMQTSVYPRKRASRDIVFVKFLEDYGVKLYEQNTKSF